MIVGIKGLRYEVDNLDVAVNFSSDLGLRLQNHNPECALFTLPDGGFVEYRPLGDPALPRGAIEGPGVHEVIWGVDCEEALDILLNDLARDHSINSDEQGVHHFVPSFGIPMALTRWQRNVPTACPDPENAPGKVNRLNRNRKWFKRAYPRTITHAVFRSPEYQAPPVFMIERLGFRLSDVQCGIAAYVRADGRGDHHNFAVLNANGPLPNCDGKTRFDHSNFCVEDIDELMVGANYLARRGWGVSPIGVGRHRADSALFYYLPSPLGGDIEYGADGDLFDDRWIPRRFHIPLFAYASWVHNIPEFFREEPAWEFTFLDDADLNNPEILMLG
ncbi:glyoxalase [Sphingopyxis indica]|uniref:glyoxalase n=1 Tax=Sphingopyxis indica TaxID=436663 RepID=UPI00293940B4|nr:glyoxalase [Sphingopyxis indica]WOF44742.1 glyoxalase [Sphingopyxis indica]